MLGGVSYELIASKVSISVPDIVRLRSQDRAIAAELQAKIDNKKRNENHHPCIIGPHPSTRSRTALCPGQQRRGDGMNKSIVLLIPTPAKSI